MKKKYRVTVGAFITHIAHGQFTVSASSEEEAIEKAKDRFYNRQMASPRNNDVGEIIVDDIKVINE